jgi:hypothetical protein
MLRIDDRPHFVPSDSGYRVAKPVWYQLYPPDRVYRSRVMFVVRSLAERTGLRNPWVRMAYLRDVARERRQSFVTVFRYMSDLRRSASSDVGYSAAFSAQMLNQQLFFHHFPGSREESINRLRYLLQRYLLQMVRRDHPDLSLFVSPIPSYQPSDSSRLIPRSSMSSAGSRFHTRRVLSRKRLCMKPSVSSPGKPAGDSSIRCPRYAVIRGSARLFNDFDYHPLPPGSALIGRAQAEAILRSGIWPRGAALDSRTVPGAGAEGLRSRSVNFLDIFLGFSMSEVGHNIVK